MVDHNHRSVSFYRIQYTSHSLSIRYEWWVLLWMMGPIMKTDQLIHVSVTLRIDRFKTYLNIQFTG